MIAPASEKQAGRSGWLGHMTKSVYTDHIAHQVELYRKRENEQKQQDQDALRKLALMQLVKAKTAGGSSNDTSRLF